MMLVEVLPQSNMTHTFNSMTETVMDDDARGNAESTPVDEKANSLTSIKIPLVSFEPILATSSQYILVNERTKRRNQLVLYNDQLQRYTIRSFIKESILEALWYEKEQHFLLLTSTSVFTFNPINKQIYQLNDLIPMEEKLFKCFALLNPSTLLIGYDEWNAEYLDLWEQDVNGLWALSKRQPLRLTSNEFIGHMITISEDNCTKLAITIYNDLTEQWRIELRHAETLICEKAIVLSGSDMHDYRVMSIKNAQSNIKWLVFSSGNSHIIAIDSQWKKTRLNYKHPVQRMALFNENYLIIRTTERVDIHFFF